MSTKSHTIRHSRLAIVRCRLWLLIVAAIVLLSACAAPTTPVATETSPGPTSTAAPSLTPTTAPTNTLQPTAAPSSTPLPSPTSLPSPEAVVSERQPTITGADNLPMNLIPGGEYYLGSNLQFVQFASRWCRESGGGDECAEENFISEAPEHAVVLDAYYMDVTEVTNAHYRRCVEAGDCAPPANAEYFNSSQYDDYPVVHVTWHDAQNYCQIIGERLPTEAEWEAAARGNGLPHFPWGDEWDPSLANTQEEGGDRLQPVGQYPGGASRFGILDLSGNVWEWVADWYDARYYESAPRENPLGPPAGSEKVLRGGGFSSLGYYARAMNRGYDDPDSSSVYRGFRCVLPAADAP